MRSSNASILTFFWRKRKKYLFDPDAVAIAPSVLISDF